MVVFFDSQLRLLKAVQVGALPDMLTFSPNGRWLLVTNRGNPTTITASTPRARSSSSTCVAARQG
jgi:hypothetical protein